MLFENGDRIVFAGDSEYSYMAVGVIYNEADEKWYCWVLQ